MRGDATGGRVGVVVMGMASLQPPLHSSLLLTLVVGGRDEGDDVISNNI